MPLVYTLLADGTSDQMLIPVINWQLTQLGIAFESQMAKLPTGPLQDRLPDALELYPCDLLIVHRDAEREPLSSRQSEIRAAINSLGSKVPTVCLIPVRMSEAWLLIDEGALRRAAGNPHGRAQLRLPNRKDVEGIPDPKMFLIDLLERASELTGRRLRKFHPHAKIQRLAELIDDFSPLSALPAYVAFQESLKTALQELGQEP